MREQRGAEELRKATWPDGGGGQRQITSGHDGFGGGGDALGLPRVKWGPLEGLEQDVCGLTEA